MFGSGSSRDLSPSKRRTPPVQRRVTIANISQPPPVDRPQPAVGNPAKLVRRSTSFGVLKASKNGVSEHTIEIDYGNGRRAWEILMDQFKELIAPKKPWDD